MQKDKEHDLWYWPGPSAEFRWVSMCHLLHWSGQQQHLLQWLQALGAQEMQWAQALDKGPWLQMYTVPGNCTLLGWQTTEEVQVGPDKLEVVAFFCYLGDMVSAVGGCELSLVIFFTRGSRLMYSQPCLWDSQKICKGLLILSWDSLNINHVSALDSVEPKGK